MEYLATENGIFDVNGNRTLVEDIVKRHLENGGKVERKYEDTEIYEIVNDQPRKVIKKCHVIKLS